VFSTVFLVVMAVALFDRGLTMAWATVVGCSTNAFWGAAAHCDDVRGHQESISGHLMRFNREARVIGSRNAVQSDFATVMAANRSGKISTDGPLLGDFAAVRLCRSACPKSL
jgi:hypothetical protein